MTQKIKSPSKVSSLIVVALSIALLTTSILYLTKGTTPDAGPYYLTVPSSHADYVVAKFENGTFYDVNGTNWNVDLLNANESIVLQGCVTALPSGGSIYLFDVPLPVTVTFGSNILIVQDYEGVNHHYSDNAEISNQTSLAMMVNNLYGVAWVNSTQVYASTMYSTTVYCTTIDALSSASGVKVLKLVVENGTSFPSSPVDREVFFRSDLGYLYLRNNSVWVQLGTTLYSNLTGTPDLTVYLNKNGATALTGDWNIGGSYGVYGATWLNSTEINAGGFWWNGLNRTDAVANPTGPYSFLISTDGTNYYCKNGTDGQICWSSTNATTVIANAWGNISSTGGLIHLKQGTFSNDGSGLTFTCNTYHDLILEGEGPSTIIDRRIAGYAINVTGDANVHNIVLRNFQISDANGKTSNVSGIVTSASAGHWVSFEHLLLQNLDVALNVSDINTVSIDTITIDQCNIGICLNSGSHSATNVMDITKASITNCASYGIKIQSSVAGGMDSINIKSAVLSSCGTGIYVDNSTGIVDLSMEHVHFETNTNYDVNLNVSVNSYGEGIAFRSCYFYGVSGVYNVYVPEAVSTNNAIASMEFDSCFFTNTSSVQLDCVYISAAGTPPYISASNNFIWSTTLPFCNEMGQVLALAHSNRRLYDSDW